ncbi:MAG: hypothetical protein VKJ04_09010 [Vampirovibrionales bacterium]|nr:hypothetical protein [Vampirovibrionales bacterium]
MTRKNTSYKASALVITLVFIVLLGLEALMVSMILVRSTGAEGGLRGQNIAVKRGAEIVVDTLKQAIYADIVANGLTPAQAWAKYKRGGSNTTYSNLVSNRYNVVNPESGANDQLGIETSAWIQEMRGNYYHLVGRARQDGVDLITHRWTMITPSCSSIPVATGLTTIAITTYPGALGTEVDPVTGRVFFSNIADDNLTDFSNFYTWHNTTGLSTILPSNRRGVGSHGMQIANDGRIFFGSNSVNNANYQDGFWTWKDNVLSTIVNGLSGPGRFCMSCGKFTQIDKSTGRVYFGTAWQSNVFTWKNNVLTTILDESGGSLGHWTPAGSHIVIGINPEEIFFTDDTSPNWLLHRWTPATGLTTAANLGGSALHPRTAFVQSDGRVWMVDYNSSGKVRSYKTGLGLSTLPGNYNYIEMWDTDRKMWRFSEFADGSVFFSTWASAYIWRPSSPQTVIALPSIGQFSAMSADKTMVAFSEDAVTRMYVWGTSSGLSTVPGTWNYPGYHEALIWSGTENKLYFGGYMSPGRVYSWDAATQQLSTIITSTEGYIGVYSGMSVDRVNGNIIYVGTDDSSAKAWAYSPSGGLTTLVSNRPNPVGFPMFASPLGGVFFGEYNSSGRYYHYHPGGNIGGCSNRTF